jgi:hypothetical protein
MSHRVGIRDRDTKRLYNSSTRHSGPDPMSSLAIATSRKYLIIPDVVCACEDNSARAIASALKCQGICRSDGIKFYHCRHTIHVTDPVHRIDWLLIQAERGGQGHA